MSIDAKEAMATQRIRQAYENWGGNHVYVALSGGKDSIACLRLTQRVFDHPIVIHNGHPGESISGFEGVLCVGEPKAENVPKFLSCVDLKCQIDGTRQDERGTVRFDGEEIERPKMVRPSTDDGIWGLHVVYPLWDWSEEEVWEYLEITGDADQLRGRGA